MSSITCGLCSDQLRSNALIIVTAPPHRRNVCRHCTTALPPLLTSKLFGFNVIIHFTPVMSAVYGYSLRLFTVRLLIDLWPWKPFQQCPRPMWRIFSPSFIKIPQLNTEISCHAEAVLTDNGRTDRRTTRTHNAFRLILLAKARNMRLLL